MDDLENGFGFREPFADRAAPEIFTSHKGDVLVPIRPFGELTVSIECEKLELTPLRDRRYIKHTPGLVLVVTQRRLEELSVSTTAMRRHGDASELGGYKADCFSVQAQGERETAWFQSSRGGLGEPSLDGGIPSFRNPSE